MDPKYLFKIVDEYNVETFNACKNTLHDYLHFHVLKPEEVRKVDLKEKLYSCFQAMQPIYVFKKEPPIETRLASFLIGILSCNVVQGEDRNREYYAQAKLCCDRIDSGLTPLTNLETLAMIVISQMRTLRNNPVKDPKKKEPLGETEYYLRSDDIHVINYIYDVVKQYNQIQDFKSAKEKASEKKLSDNDKTFIYVYTVLLFYRILQMENESV